jgi:aryl-alcohol dehydrogenase-like predicted oxidoreductase
VAVTRTLGATGLLASPLALGAGPLGDEALDESAAVRLIHEALELGLRLIDTAPSYGRSEERIGRALEGRRGTVTLVTKGAYGQPGVADWSGAAIPLAVEAALKRLRTDYLDVFLLHSCTEQTLWELLEPLLALKQAGKVRAVGYSGDGAGLEAAVACGRLDVIECSVNLFDQQALASVVPKATRAGLGVIGKRALAGAPWTSSQRPAREDLGTYWSRMQAMELTLSEPWDELAVRFAAFGPGVSTALAGTRDPLHLRRLAEAVSRGPLPAATVAQVRARFRSGWPGVV